MTVTPPEYAGCPWPVDPSCRTTEWNALDADVKATALAYASSTLERLTAYRVGNCPIKLRPDLGGCYMDPYWGSYAALAPVNWNGRWSNDGYCCRPHLCEVALPAPVGRIDEVKIDGAVIDPSNYELQNGHLLVWTGGGDCPWLPRLTQDMSLPDSAVGTFSVTYLNAYPVDLLGANAVTILALEFAKACTGKTCQLPANVTQIVRQGISMQIASGAFPDGKTGLRTVDAYIALWNPKGRTQQGMIYSPDLPQHRVVN